MAYCPIHRKEFKLLAELRAEEARVLLSEGRHQGAYYLSGYAVECSLKACIAKKTRRYQFPPDKAYTEKAYSHRLNDLLKLAGLDEELGKHAAANKLFEANWKTVEDWTEQSRYKTSGLNGRELYNAVAGADGVLPWRKMHW
jgi:HEPN domain-containing protein